MDWRQYFHTGARQVIGMFLIVFALAGTWLYHEESRILEASRTSNKIATSGVVASVVSSPSNLASEVLQTSVSSPAPSLKSTIKLSTATQAELETLPGIGPAKAKAIIDYRSAKGFKTVNDLEKVKGIGSKTLEKMKPLVEL